MIVGINGDGTFNVFSMTPSLGFQGAQQHTFTNLLSQRAAGGSLRTVLDTTAPSSVATMFSLLVVVRPSQIRRFQRGLSFVSTGFASRTITVSPNGTTACPYSAHVTL